MTSDEVLEYLFRVFPQAAHHGFEVPDLGPGRLTVRMEAGERHLRPGGTVSGPTLMTLADTASYLVVLVHVGPVALAVTTNLNIHFLRKPLPGPLYGDARLLKLGKRLAVCEVGLHGGDAGAPYAHATVTYSIPPSDRPGRG